MKDVTSVEGDPGRAQKTKDTKFETEDNEFPGGNDLGQAGSLGACPGNSSQHSAPGVAEDIHGHARVSDNPPGHREPPFPLEPHSAGYSTKSLNPMQCVWRLQLLEK